MCDCIDNKTVISCQIYTQLWPAKSAKLDLGLITLLQHEFIFLGMPVKNYFSINNVLNLFTEKKSIGSEIWASRMPGQLNQEIWTYLLALNN